MKRSSGVLLPVTSLPSKYGIGCFSKEAYKFIDWLKEAGQTYWQILPLGPTGFGDSPYQSFSTFAGNPYLIDLEKLIADDLLTEEECCNADLGNDPESIDYKKLYDNRFPLLKKAFERSRISEDPEFHKFISAQSLWLEDYSLFMALKEHYGGTAWTQWQEDIRLRKPETIDSMRRSLSHEIEFQKFMQYLFYSQWDSLKNYANEKGIKIIGDIPIYVALDSSDAWADPQMFQFDSDNVPTAVAGCPPDGFAADGQLWGNPLYRWEYHKQTCFTWWIERMRCCFSLYDVVRIDHFRGFDEYYSIPYGSKTAINGHWEKGPGLELFKAIEAALGKHKVIAEDLGYMTDSVRRLVHESGFPGMKVLEFAFDTRDTGNRNDYLPHNYPANCVAYTGTHDNQTLVSWINTISDDERTMVRDYLCDQTTPDEKLYRPLIALIMRSCAEICIIPIQDYLGYDDTCRINTPSTIGTNWKWRLKPDTLNSKLQEQLFNTAKLFGRSSDI